MRAGLLGGHRFQVGGGPPAKRPAGGGQHQLRDLLRAARAQALGQRGVLGVDRDDLTGRGRGEHQRTAGHQRLLVGQGQPGPALERGQRGSQAQGTHQRVEHDVDAGGRGGVLDDAGGRLRPREAHVAKSIRGGLVGHRDVRHTGLGALGRQQVGVATPGGQPDDLESVGVGGDHLHRLGADRPGAAEDQDLEALIWDGSLICHGSIVPPAPTRSRIGNFLRGVGKSDTL